MWLAKGGIGGNMATPFTHAIVDDMGDIIRKYRWSSKEAKVA
jgi:hypothetical protein